MSLVDGSVLAEAIREALLWRQTTLPRTLVAVSDAFAQDGEKQTHRARSAAELDWLCSVPQGMV